MALTADNLLNVIADSLPSMAKSERRVAEVILADPDAATRSSIAKLALAAEVSEPTVNRFCKKYGASGFPDFKLRLAQCLVSGIRYLSESVAPGDDVDAYTPKIFDSTINSLAIMRDKLSRSLVNQVVDKLIQARSIYFFGLGASASVAKDAQHKFFRFDLPVSYHEDVLMQRMLCASAARDDVFFLISHTGRTREQVDSAQLARDNGAVVIALTAPDSLLAQASSLVIEVAEIENTDEYMPMTSRLIQLVILDVLATGVTLRRGAEFQPHLKKIKESLMTTRYDKK